VSDSVTMGGHERLIMATRAYRFLTARLIAPWALQGTHPHGEVLEIGAGVGAMAHHLLAVTPDLHMGVTDFDPDMCAVAARSLGRYGSRVVVEQADANRLPFADNSFDFVLSFLMLHHTGDWRQTVREATRVLRPGGRLVGFDLLAGAPLHHPERFATLMPRGELENFVPTLPLVDVRVRPGLTKTLVRFVATKSDV
jgi:ubiquinone/menaquinone biosynthesis C-methylase UbiE